MEEEKNKNPLSDYAKYSSLAIQMIFIIVAGTLLGVKLDQWIPLHFPVFKVLFPIFSVFIALYAALKDLLKKK